MEEIAKRFKELRTLHNLTLKEISEKTGLSISFLSQVERGTSSLAIMSLKKIADAFNVPINYFFESWVNQNFHVKAEEIETFRLEGRSAEYGRLAGEFSGRALEPFMVIMDPGQNLGQTFTHPGEEFCYVLEGTVLVTLEGKEYLVKAGDCIHFPSTMPHELVNPSTGEKCKILSVLTPVIF
ncbi:MAG: cupin domain-containing protein [Dehalobacterium sp.]